MLSFKTFTYFYISLIFFLQLLYNGGLVDFTGVPAMFSVSLLYIAALFFFPKWPAEPESRSIIKISLINLIILAAVTVGSECVPVGFVEISKYLCSFLLFMILYSSIASRDDFREFIKIFMGFIEVYIISSMAFFFYSKYVLGTFFTGICFTLVYPYYHATMVIAAVPFALFLYYGSKTKAEKAHYLLFFMILCLNVSLTSSRVAQLNLFITVMFLALRFIKIPETGGAAKKIIIAYLLMTIFGAAFTTDAFVRITRSFTADENYDMQAEDGRFQIYRAAVQTILDHPFKGVGPGQTSLFIPRYRATTQSLVDCHNIILNRLCEGGIVYFLFSSFAFLYIIFVTFRYSRRAISSNDTAGALLSSAALISFFSLSFQGLSMPHNFLTVLIYFEYIAAAACAIALKTGAEAFRTGNSGRAAVEAENSPAAAKSVIDFEFEKITFRYVSVFSFLTVLLLCFIIFSDDINAFPQWYLNLSFALIFFIIFLRFNPANIRTVLSNAREDLAAKSLIAALMAVFLFFIFKVFTSGFYCEEGIGAISENNRRGAIFCLEKSLSAYPNMAAALHLSSLYHSAGRYDEAYKLITEYNNLLPYELIGLNNLAACQLKLAKYGECYDTLLRLDSYTAQNKGAAALAAFLITRGGRTNEGIKKFAAAAIDNPRFSASRFLCERILKIPARRDIFIRDLISLVKTNLEKNKKIIYIPSYNISAVCYNLYCRGVAKVFPEALKEFSGYDASRFIKNYYTGFLMPGAFVFDGGINFSGAGNFLYDHIVSRRVIYNAFFKTGQRADKKKPLEPHFALKRWMSPECAIDAYGLNEETPDLPAYLITASYIFMDENSLISKITEFYDLFYIARN